MHDSLAIVLRCRRCTGLLRRSRRKGALDRLLALFGYFPWRCRSCGARTWRRAER